MATLLDALSLYLDGRFPMLSLAAHWLREDLRNELQAPSTHPLSDDVVAKWKEISEILLSGTRSSMTGNPLYRKSTPWTSAPVPQDPATNTPVPRNTTSTQNCLDRDHYRCIITGRSAADGWSLQVCHLAPFALSNTPACRRNTFWLSIEMFLGETRTNELFAIVGAANVNSLSNLVTLDPSIHGLVDRGIMVFSPETGSPPQPITASTPDVDFLPNYQLRTGYTRQFNADLNTSALVEPGEITSLKPGTVVPVISRFGHISLPVPALWILRGFYASMAVIAAAAEPNDNFGTNASGSPVAHGAATPLYYAGYYFLGSSQDCLSAKNAFIVNAKLESLDFPSDQDPNPDTSRTTGQDDECVTRHEG
ncbi:hypothetical protein L873DRAFT_1795179 [Choiromyces venosus 120613-1]|uniref:HNH nuclease domain-containing protein n=1 Tax=Choiromyces venosus 120613-1 TaxID=1336337 RepID=A0A3N4J310_9PEZI|nr:hypothetical protein L873DRAFT_1795179 [Choiromyces venosus 120613-1]